MWRIVRIGCVCDHFSITNILLNGCCSLQHPDPKTMQINLTGFLNSKNALNFMTELWELLTSAQENIAGIPAAFLETKKEEIRKRQVSLRRNGWGVRGDRGDGELRWAWGGTRDAGMVGVRGDRGGGGSRAAMGYIHLYTQYFNCPRFSGRCCIVCRLHGNTTSN